MQHEGSRSRAAATIAAMDAATVLDALRDAVVMADGEGKITYANGAASEILGWPAGALLGQPLTTLIPERLQDAHLAAFARFSRGGPPTILGGPPVVVVARRADGSEVEVELSLTEQPVGAERWVVGVLRDISARRRAERAENLSRYLYLTGEVATRIALVADVHSVRQAGEAILDTVAQVIGWDAAVLWEVDDDEAARPIAWWSQPGTAGCIADLASPEHRFEVGRGLPGRVVAGRAPTWIEDVAADADFPRQQLAARAGITSAFAFPIVGTGRVLAVVELLACKQVEVDTVLLGVVAQIGGSVGQYLERRMVADELDRSRARKAAMLDSALDAIVSIDSHGTITEWNPAAAATFGWDAEAAIGRPLADLIIPARLRAAHYQGLAHHLQTGEAKLLGRQVELTAQRRNGTEFPVELAITRLQADPPEFTGFIRDISARKQAEADLAESRDRLRATAAMLQESLLPTALPQVPGLDVGAAYRPAGDGTLIGGDFYDLVHVGGRRWVAMIGDVCGKGAEAARITALMRYTLRTTALRGDDPLAAVRQCNDAVRAHRPEVFATAVYAEIDVSSSTEVRSVRAGHTVPLVRRADGSVTRLEGPGTLLGVVEDPRLDIESVHLEPGDALVLCTDGVTEARVDGGFLGERGLEELVGEAVGLDAGGLAAHIHDRAVEVQGGHTRDDIAVLVIRQPAPATSATSR